MNPPNEAVEPKKYWYRHHITECPVCGDCETNKERVYGEKPTTYCYSLKKPHQVHDDAYNSDDGGYFFKGAG